MGEDFLARHARILGSEGKRFTAGATVHWVVVGEVGAGMELRCSTPGRSWIKEIEDLVREVLYRAEEAGITREQVVQRLKDGEPIDAILPGVGDPFPGRTSAYLIWEIQAVAGGKSE